MTISKAQPNTAVNRKIMISKSGSAGPCLEVNGMNSLLFISQLAPLGLFVFSLDQELLMNKYNQRGKKKIIKNGTIPLSSRSVSIYLNSKRSRFTSSPWSR